MMRSACSALLLVLACGGVAVADTTARYDSVQGYLTAVEGKVLGDELDKGYGELGGKQRRDWAGLVFTPDSNLPKIVILAQGTDGKYEESVSLQTEGGGTSNDFVDEVRIAKGCVFVSAEWQWHGGGGWSTHQFRYQDGQWRLIGVRFHRAEPYVVTDADGEQIYDVGDVRDIDRNVLTGKVIVTFTPRGKKPVTRSTHVSPEVLLLRDYNDDQGSLPQLDR